MIGLIMCGRKRQPRGVEFKDLGWEKDNEIIWLALEETSNFIGDSLHIQQPAAAKLDRKKYA